MSLSLCLRLCVWGCVCQSLGYSNVFQSLRTVTRFSNFSGTPGDLICQEQTGTDLAVLFGPWGGMCWLPELEEVNQCG